MSSGDSPGVSVIIPTRSRPAELRRCLASLAAQQYSGPFEIIVVDDGGEPPARAVIAGSGHDRLPLRCIELEHQGPGGARLAGVRQARGEVLAFLDDDCTVPPDYLEAVARVFAGDATTHVVQVALENPEPDNLYGETWAFTLEQTLRVNLHPAPGGKIACDVLGGVMLARRQVFHEVTFDTSLNRSREDADLRLQLRDLGIPIFYEPSIRVFHHPRRGLAAYLTQFFGYGRGGYRFREKWNRRAPPWRHVKLTSVPALKTLVARYGAGKGLRMYGLIAARGLAHRCGMAYQRAADEHPHNPVRRGVRFVRHIHPRLRPGRHDRHRAHAIREGPIAARPLPLDDLACPECRGRLEAQLQGSQVSALTCTSGHGPWAVEDGIVQFIREDPAFPDRWTTTYREPEFGGPSGWIRRRNLHWGIPALLRPMLVGVGPRPLRILDLGSGGGWQFLTTFGRVTAVDMDPRALRAAAALYDRCLRARAERLPLAPGTMDVVFSVRLFEHLPEPQFLAALREIRRVLRPGGHLVFVADLDSEKPILRWAKRFPAAYVRHRIERVGHHGLRSLGSTRSILEREGFAECRTTPVNKSSLLQPVTALWMFDNELGRRSRLLRLYLRFSRFALGHRHLYRAVYLALMEYHRAADRWLPDEHAFSVAGDWMRPEAGDALRSRMVDTALGRGA